MSIRTLKGFFDCLSMFSMHPVDKIDDTFEGDINTVALLIGEGCLSGTVHKSLGSISVHNVVITPKGAIALGEWSAILKASKWTSKFSETLGRMFWLVLGIVLSTIIPTLAKLGETSTPAI